MSTIEFKNEVSIVLAGEAGQGIQSIENLLVNILKKDGYNVFATKEYMSRIRGGTNSTEIRVSSKKASAYVDRINILVPLDKDSIPHLQNRITKDTVILGEKDLLKDSRVLNIPFQKLASDIGNAIYSSTIATGAICGLLQVDKKAMADFILGYFHKKGQEISDKNIEAAGIGYNIGGELIKNKIISIIIDKDPVAKNEIMMSGSDAAALGAIAGGCDFTCAYPMTPSTGVFTAMAAYSKNLDIVVEQVEDEIGVINMALGAWYAGARALVTTSGGGFALMVEGLSLAGMLELPIVVYLAQRPGPATGLPTRTEQGDLNFALYSGHGEFPRIILAPGNTEQAFYMSQKAFNMADKFQSPVIILSDQYLADTYYNTPEFKVDGLKIERFIVETKEDYQRYKFTENGISPRGIPGFGTGRVHADSDEHTEDGYITEDMDNVRVKMVEKRLKKLGEIKKEIIEPELIGSRDYETLVVGWGSTYNIIKEALEKIGNKQITFLHFSQVYPLHESTAAYISKAKNTIIIENNATCQFGQLIKLSTGIEIKNRILKYNGMPFSVEEITKKILEFGF